MFKFLKEKLKSTLAKIGKQAEEVEEKPKEEVKEEEKPKEKKVKKKKEKKLLEKSSLKEEQKEKEEVKEEIEEKVEEELTEEPKKKLFERIKEKVTTKKISEDKFEELFEELELILLENNVAVEVIDKIKEDLKKEIVDKPIERKKIEDIIKNSLEKSIKEVLDVKQIDLIKEAKKKKPYVIVFVGINGSGKTTTIAKVVKLLQKNKLSCVLAAADTFRAASIEQLQEHANKLKVGVIRHNYGSDPAAVAYDAVQHAKTKGIDVVLVDTAGRMHTQSNLMAELNKVIRVVKPDLKIFVGEAITGNDCTEQARAFNEEIEIDGIILSKADIDEKGGTAISVGYITGKPILYIGTGQGYDNLEEFDSKKVLESLGF